MRDPVYGLPRTRIVRTSEKPPSMSSGELPVEKAKDALKGDQA